jgi:hypothetical protein
MDRCFGWDELAAMHQKDDAPGVHRAGETLVSAPTSRRVLASAVPAQWDAGLV